MLRIILVLFKFFFTLNVANGFERVGINLYDKWMIELVSCIQLHLVASCKLHSKTKESFEQQININHIRNQHQIDANTKKWFQNKAVKTGEFICIFYEYTYQQSRTKKIQIIWFICRIIFCICFLPLFDPIGGCRRRSCNLIHWNVLFSIFFHFFLPRISASIGTTRVHTNRCYSCT